MKLDSIFILLNVLYNSLEDKDLCSFFFKLIYSTASLTVESCVKRLIIIAERRPLIKSERPQSGRTHPLTGSGHLEGYHQPQQRQPHHHGGQQDHPPAVYIFQTS